MCPVVQRMLNSGAQLPSADGKTLVVGSPGDSSQGSDRGSVRAYRWLDKQWKPYGEPLYGVSLVLDHRSISMQRFRLWLLVHQLHQTLKGE